jgi:hypothetical protein
VTHSFPIAGGCFVPCRPSKAVTNESEKSDSMLKIFMSGEMKTDRDSSFIPADTSATRAAAFFIAAERLRMCFRAVLGSIHPSRSHAVSISIGDPDARLINSMRPSHLNGLLGIRYGESILLVYGLFFDAYLPCRA